MQCLKVRERRLARQFERVDFVAHFTLDDLRTIQAPVEHDGSTLQRNRAQLKQERVDSRVRGERGLRFQRRVHRVQMLVRQAQFLVDQLVIVEGGQDEIVVNPVVDGVIGVEQRQKLGERLGLEQFALLGDAQALRLVARNK